MQLIPVQTRRLEPPQDDLWPVLVESLPPLQNGDVVLVSSKVMAIDEGRCVPEDKFDKQAHLAQEAQVIIPRPNWPAPLTIINNVIVGSAGVDRSNSNGYYTLLPSDPFASANRLHERLCAHYQLTELGIVITDSRSHPCRYGATGVAIGFWGIAPLVDYRGEHDLFGREMKIERSNIVDGLAAGAAVVMGEAAEGMPVVIAREVPNLTFTTSDTKDELFCPFADDILNVLYERFL